MLTNMGEWSRRFIDDGIDGFETPIGFHLPAAYRTSLLKHSGRHVVAERRHAGVDVGVDVGLDRRLALIPGPSPAGEGGQICARSMRMIAGGRLLPAGGLTVGR